MRKFTIIMLALVACVFAGNAQEMEAEVCDTLPVLAVDAVEAPDSIVTQMDDWSIDLPFGCNRHTKVGRNSRSRFSAQFGGFGFGFVNAMDKPAAMNEKMSNSFEFFIDHIIAVAWRPTCQGASFRIGVGIDWKNYRMTGTTRFIKQDSKIALGDYPADADPKFSRLKVFAVTMPVTFTQEFGKGFSFSAGAVVNFNTHASMKTRYAREDGDVTLSNDNIHQRKVTVDVMGQLGFKSIGVYVKYCPMNVLNTEFGPSFKSLSAGITIGY